ncbi:MAG TPA: DUF6599 family protein [Verrucomicrobiae bacterium]|nr:DUF6599 family protein [Verrucomicrobiae bacterium]
MAANTEVYRPPTTEPVFNTFRRKPLRPFYSLREFRIGIIIIVALGGLLLWVMRRGAHPDPTLFTVPQNLLTDKGKAVTLYKRPVEPWVEPGTVGAPTSSPRLDPFPDAVASADWRMAGPPQMFDESNLYVKIDGREGFYKSYGFKKLYFLSLASMEQDGLTIDIELFDLGKTENALGALAAEISSPDAEVRTEKSGLSYATRNGAFLSQGRFYARIIGSDDNDLIRKKVTGLREALLAALPAEPLPWSYALFAGRLHLNPFKIQYDAENAFSFGFATQVYSATLPNSETELFISRRESDAEAIVLAAKFAEGFAAFGKKLAHPQSVILVQNEYTSAIDAVRTHGTYVIGVREAKSPQEATQWLDRLASELDNISGKHE